MKEIYNSWEVDTSERIIDLTKSGKVSYEKKYYAKCLNCGTGGHIVRYRDVKIGKSKRCKSCGVAKSNFKHGESNSMKTHSRLYRIWTGMRDRCRNKSNPQYENYGGSGVTISSEFDNYVDFKEWALTNGYSDKLEIDKDIICDKLNIVPKIYSKDTCIFISKSKNISYAQLGRSKSNLHKLKMHQNRNLSDEDIFEIIKLVDENKIMKQDIAKLYNISSSTISNILSGKLKTLKEIKSILKI